MTEEKAPTSRQLIRRKHYLKYQQRERESALNRYHQKQIQSSKEQKTLLKQRKQTYDQNHKPKRHKRRNALNKVLRQKIIEHYSQGTNKCVRCGFSDIRALTIDHINGGGCDHRKQIKTPLAHWIKKNNFPEGFQILCMNCQIIKKIENRELQYVRKRERSANDPPNRKGQT